MQAKTNRETIFSPFFSRFFTFFIRTNVAGNASALHQRMIVPFALFAIFSVPISTAAATIMGGLVLLLWLLFSAYQRPPNTIKAITAAILILLMVLGAATLYAPVPLSEAIKVLSSYRVLLYIVVFYYVFQHIAPEKGLDAFVLAMLITLLLSYVTAFTPVPMGNGLAEDATVFKNHITQNALMAFAAYLFALRAIYHRYAWLYLSLAFISVMNVLFLVQGRTGYILLFVLSLLFIWQVLPRRQLWRGLAGLLVMLGIVFISADSFRTQTIETLRESLAYDALEVNSSTELRLSFLLGGLEIVQARLWQGYGTGSFKAVYHDYAVAKNIPATANPHNEYLYLAVQLGVGGVILFILLLVLLWRHSLRLAPEYRCLLQALTLWMAVGCMFNSFLTDVTEGHFFAFMCAIFLAAPSATGMMPALKLPHPTNLK
jgi:O-antigen ligase